MNNKKRIVVNIVAGVVLFAIIVAGLAIGLAGRMLRSKPGEAQGGSRGLLGTISDMSQVAISPKEGFPGVDRMTILCMGIDNNWTDSDVVYTKNARTDTLFILTLDLLNHKATMLSIPRDTYAHITGTKWNFKINAAYETGGPQRAIATVDELLGVHADHYMVLNIDATKKMVDALGGVDVNVEHEMHYHDKWGHLDIDLYPGFQHLDGDKAVEYARYRHGDMGAKPSPEDGDDRRMARQHVLLKAMIAKAKTFANVAQAPQLIDVAMGTIRTDLTRTQLFDLAAIYRGIQPDQIQTASLTGDDFIGPSGAWLYKLDMVKAHAYVDWLVKGDETAPRGFTTVIVKNGTHVPGLAQRAVELLHQNGYTDVINGGNADPAEIQLAVSKSGAPPAAGTKAAPARSVVVDSGVPDPNSPTDASALLGISSADQEHITLKPNHAGWTPPPTLTIVLGSDYASLAATTPAPDTAQTDNATVPTAQ